MSRANMIIAVTGSSGFVGRHLISKLINLDVSIIELDLVNGLDITDWNQACKVDKFDVLVHLAAKTYVPESYQASGEFYRVNLVGTLNVLELCKIYDAKLIFASSYVYGQPKYLPIDEKHPTSAFNPYAASKILCEILCENYHRHFGVPIIIFRPFNIYGEGQNDSFLIPSIIKQAESGEILLKDPSPKRDFIFIDDIVKAYFKAVEYDKTSFEVFNIGSGRSYSVQQIAEMIARHMNYNIKIKYSGERRENEVMDTVADISKAQRLLCWKPSTDFENGIKQWIDHVEQAKVAHFDGK